MCARAWEPILPNQFISNKDLIKLKKIFYLFMRHRERERQRHREREKQATCREPNVGLDPGSPGPHPGPKAVLNC